MVLYGRTVVRALDWKSRKMEGKVDDYWVLGKGGGILCTYGARQGLVYAAIWMPHTHLPAYEFLVYLLGGFLGGIKQSKVWINPCRRIEVRIDISSSSFPGAKNPIPNLK